MKAYPLAAALIALPALAHANGYHQPTVTNQGGHGYGGNASAYGGHAYGGNATVGDVTSRAGAVSGSRSGAQSNNSVSVGGDSVRSTSIAIGLATPYCGNGGGLSGGGGTFSLGALFNWMDTDCKVVQAVDRWIAIGDVPMARALLMTLPRAERAAQTIPLAAPDPVALAPVVWDTPHPNPPVRRRAVRRVAAAPCPVACRPAAEVRQ